MVHHAAANSEVNLADCTNKNPRITTRRYRRASTTANATPSRQFCRETRAKVQCDTTHTPSSDQACRGGSETLNATTTHVGSVAPPAQAPPSPAPVHTLPYTRTHWRDVQRRWHGQAGHKQGTPATVLGHATQSHPPSLHKRTAARLSALSHNTMHITADGRGTQGRPHGPCGQLTRRR